MAFEQNEYYKEKFSKLDLSHEIFRFKSFEECEFNNCSFIECKFEKTRFLNCTFNHCILSAVVPMNCRLNEVKFTECKVIGLDWTKAQKVSEIEFHQSQINYSNFKLMALPKIKIIQCEAKEVDFTEADLSQGVFRGTDFEKSRFFKTNLSQADFKDAHNYYIDVNNNTLKKTHFSMPEAINLLRSLDIILDENCTLEDSHGSKI